MSEVYCPYCGTTMLASGCFNTHWFVCPECHAESPKAPSFEEAATVAQSIKTLRDDYTFKEWATAMMEQMPSIVEIETRLAGDVVLFNHDMWLHVGKSFPSEPNQSFTRADLFPEPEPDYKSWEGEFVKVWDGDEEPEDYPTFVVLYEYRPSDAPQMFLTKENGYLVGWKHARRYTRPEPVD